MADLGRTVTGIVARFGQPCTISWPAVGMGKTATPAATTSTSIRIRQRKIANVGGQATFETIGTLGPIERDLQGAKITVGSKTYNVVAVISKIIEGLTYQQLVTLA